MQIEIVMPSVSILAEPSVAVVDKVVLRRGTREVAQAYLEYLYSPEGQEIIARNYYRPRDAAVAAKYASAFPQLKMFTIADLGGWARCSRSILPTARSSIRSTRTERRERYSTISL
jgi:ABC-type sulfate transport system substrate-binding protein